MLEFAAGLSNRNRRLIGPAIPVFLANLFYSVPLLLLNSILSCIVTAFCQVVLMKLPKFGSLSYIL